MRTLLIRPGAIGDCILHFPTLEAKRSAYTEVWISRPLVPLVLFADRVRALADTGLDLVGLPGLTPPAATLDALRGFDRIHSWYGTARPEFRAALAGLPVEWYPALPSGPGDGVPAIPIRGPRHDAVILHPFSGSAKKNWPMAHFQRLAELLGPVQWTAGPDEPLPGAVRFDDLAQLAAWIFGARLYIGNDSGITHLAAAVGTRTVALFGPTDPTIWRPRGAHVLVLPFDAPEAIANHIKEW